MKKKRRYRDNRPILEKIEHRRLIKEHGKPINSSKIMQLESNRFWQTVHRNLEQSK